MKVEYLSSFAKDLNKIKAKSTKLGLIKLIELFEQAQALEHIPNTKKLKGHNGAFRTRVGDYRLGFFFEDGIVLFARFVHRKDIYRIFP